MIRKFCLLFVLAGIVVFPALAQTQIEDKYTEEFNKLKDSSSYLYRDGADIEWSIKNYDPSYDYYIRVYSWQHAQIVGEYKLKPGDLSGKITFIYPKTTSKVHINLQKWIPEGKEIEYCEKTGRPCKVGENLDIITVSPIEKITVSDNYILNLR